MNPETKLNEAIFQKVQDIVVEQLSVNKEEVKAESSFANDLGADSLDTVEKAVKYIDEKVGATA